MECLDNGSGVDRGMGDGERSAGEGTTMATKKTAFETRCKKASEETGVPYYCLHGETHLETKVFEDDGSLHIRRPDGTRAIFDVSLGQQLEPKEQNENTRKVLTALKIPGAISKRTIIDEDVESDDVCPECRRPY